MKEVLNTAFEKEKELKFFEVSVKTSVGLLVELVPAIDEKNAIEHLRGTHSFLTKRELNSAEIKEITKEEYGRRKRQQFAIRNNMK